jgi:hypothetical protein
MTSRKSQIDKFREAAREHGADFDESKFDQALRKIASKDAKEQSEALKDLADQIGQTDAKPKR